MKMAYAPLSKLVSRDAMSSICPSSVKKPTLSEVLQSDSVKRLFCQPNIIIKTFPIKPVTFNKDVLGHKINGVNLTQNLTRPPEISIFPDKQSTVDKEKEDANLLPSKVEHKKSEIALFPLEKKSCGHYEQCESIVCDVTVQQYVDKDGISPMLALTIEEDEINAPVEKHCENECCDALSIDHDRCRRALIKLHRCDRSHACDICGTTFNGRISRVYHMNCTRKREYVHNNVNRSHLQKERMRMRELQILENAKIKKHNYSDPERVMEALRKNDELIIIPQRVSSQISVATTTSIPGAHSVGSNHTHPTHAQLVKLNSQITKVTEDVPLTFSQNTTIFSNTSHLKDEVKPISQIRLPNQQQNSHLGSTSIPIPITTRLPTTVQAQIQVSVPKSASSSAPILTPAPKVSVPTLALTLAPTSASTPVSTSASTAVQTLTLALASNLASAAAPASTSTSTSTSIPTLTLTLAPTPSSVPVSVPAAISTPTVITTSASAPHKQYIHFAVSPQTTTAQSVNNLIVSPSHIITNTSAQPKAFLAPIRVVPIKNLISPPSLLHHTQGVPKFCIVAEKMVTPVIAPKPPSIQSAAVVATNNVKITNVDANVKTTSVDANVKTINVNANVKTTNVETTSVNVKANNVNANVKITNVNANAKATNVNTNVKVDTSNFSIRKLIPKARKIVPKITKAKKNFFCVYCSKNITTDWYFKMHIAKHKGEKLFFCHLCNESFYNNYHLKKHITNQHIDQKDIGLSCDKCNYTCSSIVSFKSHLQTHNKADIQKKSKKKRKLEFLKNENDKSNLKRKIKRMKLENISDNQKKLIEKHNNKELTIKIDGNKKGFNFVSAKEIVEPENFEQESAITSR
ncbi:A-agglutinin anchorage subunit [Monomorium pharaonis]|uniref:A-agglutinin anchorage subunit n=1 Tax=Monomorium pharaonis TaxID=307658 RepID=UPI00063F7EA9|nr:A-agglutinin anchorage subunit [Monomorium pharaonis]